MPLQNFLIESSSLSERRAITVFLPSNHQSETSYPIVYCTDGQALVSFSRNIEQATNMRELPELVLVGLHSSKHRSQEYTLDQDTSRFRFHEQFFMEEVPCWLRNQFGFQTERDRTGIFGFSHGGAFALTMASRHSDLLGLVIAFSPAGMFEGIQFERQRDDRLPRFYLSAGTREKPLLKTARRLARHLKDRNVDYVITERPAGHDFEFWQTELPLALQWALQR